MRKLKIRIALAIAIYCLLGTNNSFAQQYLLDGFQQKLSKIKNSYYIELERDNASELLRQLDQLKHDEEDALEDQGLPSSFYPKIREYKKLTNALLLFISTASGKIEGAEYYCFPLVMEYLELSFSVVKEQPECGKVLKVEFGSPKYSLYFVKNEIPASKNARFYFAFSGDQRVGNQSFKHVFQSGDFGCLVGEIIGFSRFQAGSNYKNIVLSSFKCKFHE
jgi:hypothetical protein